MIRVGTLGLVTDDNDFSSTQIRSSPPLLDGSEADETVTEMLADALRDLGYSSFRPGQVWNNNSLTIMVLTNPAMWDIKDYSGGDRVPSVGHGRRPSVIMDIVQ